MRWPTRWPSWPGRLAPPLLAFLLVRGAFAITAVVEHKAPLSADLWSRSDSGHYLSIAQGGYQLFDCAKIAYAQAGWCGNAGWLPGYPLVLGAVARLGVAPLLAGAALSALFALGSLCVLWLALLDGRVTRANLLTLALAAVFPGAVYQHAIFPISMFTLAALGALAFALRGRWLAAGACGAVGAFSYSTGFLLAPVAALAMFLARDQPWRVRIGRAAAIAAPTAAGFAAVLVVHRVSVGAWDAFFRVQAKYGHGVHNPIRTLVSALASLHDGHWDGDHEMLALQTLLVAVASIAMLAASAKRDRSPEPWLPWLRIYLVSYWLFPLVMGGGVSLFRAEALLMPTVLLARRLPMAVQIVLFALAAPLCIAMAALFFRAFLV